MSVLSEYQVRYLVNELAKDMIELDDILKNLGITKEDYIKISTTRAFRETLSAARIEWQGATNTAKRTKLKAAAIAEELMLTVFFAARDNKEEPLSSKTKALETIAKIGGLGALEPPLAAGAIGNVFNLQINYSGGETSETIQIGSPIIENTIETEYVEEETVSSFSPLSSVFAEEPLEDL